MHSNLNTLEMKRVYISGVYISQLIRFARVSSHVADFNACNKSLTAKLLQQGYWYHKLRKTFSKFYRRHYELVSKFNVGLKPLLHQGLSEPEFYGNLVYKSKKNKTASHARCPATAVISSKWQISHVKSKESCKVPVKFQKDWPKTRRGCRYKAYTPYTYL